MRPVLSVKFAKGFVLQSVPPDALAEKDEIWKLFVGNTADFIGKFRVIWDIFILEVIDF